LGGGLRLRSCLKVVRKRNHRVKEAVELLVKRGGRIGNASKEKGKRAHGGVFDGEVRKEGYDVGAK